MPVITVGDQTCYVLAYENALALPPDFVEAADPDSKTGGLLSDDVAAQLSAQDNGCTDVFIFSHGFMNTLDSAEASYTRWVQTMAAQTADIAALGANFKPLLVGLHWPSVLPDFDAFKAQTLANTTEDAAVAALVPDAAQRPAAAAAVRLVLPLAQAGTRLTRANGDAVAEAFAAAYAEARTLRAGLAGGLELPTAPTSAEWWKLILDVLGDAAKWLILVGLLDFWLMYYLSQVFGGGAARRLALKLMTSASGTPPRFHAMGHSLGAGVVSAMIAPSDAIAALPQPFRAAYLVEGAIPRWSYSDKITIHGDLPGIFSANLEQGRLTGPLLATKSKNDEVLRWLYWIAATLAGWDGTTAGHEAHLLSDGDAALGWSGITGALATPWNEAVSRILPAADDVGPDSTYAQGQAYVLDGAACISGHSDIAHPQVAHAFWRAVLATVTG